MMHLRLRDVLSALCYRLLGRVFGVFGSYGPGARLVRPLHIFGARNIHIGAHVRIQGGAYLIAHGAGAGAGGGPAPRLEFGDGAAIGHHVHIVCEERIVIGPRALLADRVFIADNSHVYRDAGRPIMDQGLRIVGPVEIGAGSWLGENACVIGCRIGRNAVVAANSVVTRDVPDYCVAAGAPAVIVRRYCPDTETWRRTDPAGAFVS